MPLNGVPHPKGESWGKKVPGMGKKVSRGKSGCPPLLIGFIGLVCAVVALVT